MKTKHYLALLSITLLITSFTSVKNDVITHGFHGAWQLKSSNYGNGEGKPNIVTLKVFQDSTFHIYLCTPAASVETTTGKFTVVSDSLYSESIVKAYNSVMEGRTYEIKYQKTDDTLIMSGEFDGPNPDGTISKRPYTETWVKLGFPPPQK